MHPCLKTYLLLLDMSTATGLGPYFHARSLRREEKSDTFRIPVSELLKNVFLARMGQLILVPQYSTYGSIRISFTCGAELGFRPLARRRLEIESVMRR